MKTFKNGQIPDLDWQRAVKKPIAIRVFQIDEPFKVETMESEEGVPQHGKAGDYLIVGVRGEMYPIDQDIFRETYDVQEEE